MKRKHNCIAYHTRSKKQKLYDQPLPTKKRNFHWISATHIRNYMINDSLVDWLKQHKTHSRPYIIKPKGGFVDFIMQRGIEFEQELIKYIHENKIPVVTVSEYITESSIQKTIELMKAGTPIIHSAPVQNNKNHTRGIIDLLIRSDYLDKLVNTDPLSEEERIIPSPKLNHNFHYLVIDIKFSTLPLRADGIHILNSGSYSAYKAQCLIYTQAIGLIQGYTPNYSFILGRRWKYTKTDINFKNFSCLDKLGVINYQTVDKKYVDETKKALNWVRDVKKNGHKWSVSPPSRQELYPNMCKDSGKWQKHKKEIAENIGEITNIWYCGTKNREIGMQNNITSWKDPQCDSKSIGISGTRARSIDKIIEINRDGKAIIEPSKITSRMFNWRKADNEMFVDFETLSDVFSPFDQLPQQKQTDMIFMIGVYWKNSNKNKNKWEYKNFVCKEATYDEEFRIMDEFNNFVKTQNKPRLWYWCAENSFWKRSANRQYDIADTRKRKRIADDWTLTNWADMCELFKYEPIVVKGCFNFGLKSISTTMRNHGLIKSKIDSECSSGMSAMIKAYQCYQEFENSANCPVMQDIGKYNKFDVEVLHEIITYLRNNH